MLSFAEDEKNAFAQTCFFIFLVAIERVERGISFGHDSSSLKNIYYDITVMGFIQNVFTKKKKCFYIRSSGTQEGGARGWKKGFPGAVRGAELMPGSSL